MKISRVAEILDAKVLTGQEHLDREVHSVCGSDMMSDVLAYVQDQGMLLTGLINVQVIRTLLMMDMSCVVFLRGKMPGADIIEFAAENEVVVLQSELPMYESCGKLYSAGLGRSEGSEDDAYGTDDE
jgi:predicted transcriptional regulator